MNINLIKNRISCVDYAVRNNINVSQSGDRCVSPLRPEAKNPSSFIVYDDYYFDFGTGHGGDVIDFCAALQFGGDKGKAIRFLAEITGVQTDDDQYNEWVQYTQNLCNEIEHYHKKLTEDDYKYLHNRNIHDDTIERLKIGHTDNGRLCIPYWKNGYICYYATRAMPNSACPDSKYMKMRTDEFNENVPWGMQTLNRKSDTLIIAEGAFDAMSFEQENYPVLSAITGYFSKGQLPLVLNLCRSFKQVFLIYDNDKISHAGEAFTIKMAKILFKSHIPFIIGQTPSMYKDVSEYYAAGGNLSLLVSSAVKGDIFIASTITDKKEFEKFAYSSCRYMTRPAVSDFFTTMHEKSNFDSSWLKALEKSCSSPPMDTFIADEVLTEHKILYNNKISFFEYNGRFWEQKSDEQIQSYIDKNLGIHSTGARVTSVLKLIKSRCITNRIFNVSNVINFTNGTLELTPEIKFRDHSADDLCTYILDYPYDANAHSNEWERFIDSITDNDPRKAALLQEFSGYVLFPDNRLQKCAVLIGNGANGKSVFLNVITRIFGASNVSNVEMSSLTKDFQCITLLNSWVNISAETKTDVTGAESRFKQIVAGDEISACYKGKDYISFKPRAKMFIACNEYMKSYDTTEGWTRRFSFINFPIKFTDTPVNANERKADPSITNRLTTPQSLTAIFNWVLSGYEQLMAVNSFTETDDQVEIEEEFKEVSNPLIVFLKEFTMTQDYISSVDFYNCYKSWCYDANHSAMSRTAFSKKIIKLLPEYCPNMERTRSDVERGFCKKHDA